MKKWIEGIFLSKKMIAFIIGLACDWLAAKGFELPMETRLAMIAAITGLAIVLIGGQAHADARTGGATSARKIAQGADNALDAVKKKMEVVPK